MADKFKQRQNLVILAFAGVAVAGLVQGYREYKQSSSYGSSFSISGAHGKRQVSQQNRDPYDRIITPAFLRKLSAVESNGNITAVNPFTGAAGDKQIKEQTFLEQVYKHGEKLGYGDVAQHITRIPVKDDKGRQIGEQYGARDDKILNQILRFREDPDLSTGLARIYMKQGMARIDQDMPNRKFRTGEFTAYSVWRYGPTGAYKFARALEETPHLPFNQIVEPVVCNQNPKLCDNGNPAFPRTVHQVYALHVQKLASH